VHSSTDHSTMLESIEIQLQAQYYPAALTLLARHWPRLSISHGDGVRALMERIPEREWASDPAMLAAIGASYLGVDAGREVAALPWLDSAERLARRDSPHQVPAILLHHSAALRAVGHVQEAEAKAEDARARLDDDLELAPRERIALQSRAAAQLGLALLHRGSFERADRELQLAAALDDASDGGPGEGLAARPSPAELAECHGARALLRALEGDYPAAKFFVALARSSAKDEALLRSHFGAPALIAEAMNATENPQPDDAPALARAAVAAAGTGEWLPLALYAQATASFVGARPVEGLEQLRRADDATRSWHGSVAVTPMNQGLRAAILLALSDLEQSESALRDAQSGERHTHCAARHTAALLLKRGDPQGCLDALAPCREMGEIHSVRSAIDVLLLTSAARYRLVSPSKGDLALDRALHLAASRGIRAPFRSVPAVTLRRMLDRASDRNQPADVEGLLDELRAEIASAPGKLIEPLSDREIVVARHLALDKTVGQIAQDLFISVNTVKTHVRSIYRKLEANSRGEALQRYRSLGLGKSEITLD
jgi:LuxR family maltose regulon positive regulatory protein